MTSKKVSCTVDTQSDLGVYANAFRVIQDGPEVILDFCLYSESENVAKTVSRVRVNPSFLEVITSRIEEATNSGPQSGVKYLVLSSDNTEN
jgi:hypothetical protein